MTSDGYKIILRTPDNPVDHGRSAKRDAKLLPVLFLAVKRETVHILLVHDIRNRTWRCKGMIHK